MPDLLTIVEAQGEHPAANFGIGFGTLAFAPPGLKRLSPTQQHFRTHSQAGVGCSRMAPATLAPESGNRALGSAATLKTGLVVTSTDISIT